MVMINNRLKPYIAVIFLQFCYAGLAILAKFALSRRMNHYTFAVYRNDIAAIVLAPFAYFIEREVRPQMTISIVFKILLLGLLEPVIDQNVYYVEMKYTSASFSTTMNNVLPALTFLMAWIFRLEAVNIRERHSQAKILGTLMTVGGAMIMTLITGHEIRMSWTHSLVLPENTNSQSIKGVLLIAAGCLCFSTFYILQAFTLKTYPELSLAALICLGGAIQGAFFTFILERHNISRVWSLHFDAKLLGVAYAGIVSSGIGYFLTGLIMKEKGPVFITAFNLLSMVIVTILQSVSFAEPMNLGSILGAVIIVAGLYLVIWGKSKDKRASNRERDQIVPDKELTGIGEEALNP